MDVSLTISATTKAVGTKQATTEHPLVSAKIAADHAESITFAPGIDELKPSTYNYVIHQEYPDHEAVVGGGGGTKSQSPREDLRG
jgi:hypothetical protein